MVGCDTVFGDGCHHSTDGTKSLYYRLPMLSDQREHCNVKSPLAIKVPFHRFRGKIYINQVLYIIT